MISLYFGLPGCGKTTLMTKFANDFVRGKKYQNVYANIPLDVDGVTQITNDMVGVYDISNGALLIDEATLFADSRDYKTIRKDLIQYFLLHRHYHIDIYLFTQQWDGVDRKIRVITDRCYHVYKGAFTGRWFTKYYPIPYGIIIPEDGENMGQIVQGYYKPHFLVRLLNTKWIFRPAYYSKFDSFAKPELKPLYNESNPETAFRTY